MTVTTRAAIVLTVLAAAGSAQAQTYGAAYGQQPPLYPYAVQQPYAVEVAPNTYVIRRPAARSNPANIACINCSRNEGYAPAPAPSAPRSVRPHKPVDRGLVEELRKSRPAKAINETVITTKKVVREKPVIRETVRVVDEPPRVIERRHIVEDLPPLPPRRHADASADVVGDTGKSVREDAKSPRVIRAEAEITIIGPDRMSIRLFRKRGEPQAEAQPNE